MFLFCNEEEKISSNFPETEEGSFMYFNAWWDRKKVYLILITLILTLIRGGGLKHGFGKQIDFFVYPVIFPCGLILRIRIFFFFFLPVGQRLHFFAL